MLFTKFAQYSHYSGKGLNHCFLGESFKSELDLGYGATTEWKSSVTYSDTTWKSIVTGTGYNIIDITYDADGKPCAEFKSTYPTYTAFLRLHYRSTSTKLSQRDLFNLGSSFTVQMTCTYEEFVNYRGIMGLAKAFAGETAVIFGQYQNGNLVWGIFPYTTSSNSVWVTVPQAQIPSGKFNWCFIYDKDAPNTNGGTISLYINNVHKGTVELTGGAPNFSTNIGLEYGVSLGHAYHAVDRFMKGKIYSLLIYNRAISQAELTNNYMIDKRKYLIPNFY